MNDYLATPCAFVRRTPFRPFIYGLVDPLEPNHIRYVGVASKYAGRPFIHAQLARRESTEPSHPINWIRKLQREGRDPVVMILEEFPENVSRDISPGSLLGFVEDSYINSLRAIGHKLTNQAPGGQGGDLGPEANAKRAAKGIGNKYGVGTIHSKESKQQMSESMKRHYAEHPEALKEIGQRSIGNTYGLGAIHSEKSVKTRTEKLNEWLADPQNQPKIIARGIKQSETKAANPRPAWNDGLSTPCILTPEELEKRNANIKAAWTPERRKQHGLEVSARRAKEKAQGFSNVDPEVKRERLRLWKRARYAKLRAWRIEFKADPSLNYTTWSQQYDAKLVK
jgi:hypothetical protein